MTRSKLTNFCKNEDCPSSPEVLEFQAGKLPAQTSAEIRSHIGVCDFCAAEVEFYTHFPQAEGAIEPAEIPGPLYELAEALLKNRQNDASSLNSLLKEKSSLVVDNA